MGYIPHVVQHLLFKNCFCLGLCHSMQDLSSPPGANPHPLQGKHRRLATGPSGTSLWCIPVAYLTPNSLYLLFPHLLCPSAFPSSRWEPLVCSLFLCFLFVIFTHWLYFLDSLCKWYRKLFVFPWLISLSMMSSKSIHVAASGKISFFFMAEQYSIVYI